MKLIEIADPIKISNKCIGTSFMKFGGVRKLFAEWVPSSIGRNLLLIVGSEAYLEANVPFTIKMTSKSVKIDRINE